VRRDVVLVLNACRQSGLDLLQCTTLQHYPAEKSEQERLESQLRNTNGRRLTDDFDYRMKP
jgi:hypothetical protein